MRILITGGTGYFGRALIDYLTRTTTHTVCCLSRSESKQAELRRLYPTVKFFLGDVRDRSRVRRALRDCSLVIHAAALKRIETGQYNPSEFVKTNVLGTQNVVEEAEDAGVDCVVLSTDKAWAPVSPYGYSKALAESVALASGAAVVRYGNVAGSTGSVIPTWRRLAQEGKAVWVTDLECTRFWMTVNEAIELVLDTADSMPQGIVIPDWLPAYRLGDLLIAMGIDYYEAGGLPPWEKKHEGMRDGLTSDMARRMSIGELMEGLKNV